MTDQPKRGRPSDYETEFAEQAAKLCMLGATDFELADFFDVDTRTIYRWKNTQPDFCQAVVAGKEKADERVERALFNRAVGYSHETVKIFMPAGADGPVYAPYVEHVPPDTGAAMNWLKNRRPDQWRDKITQEHVGANGGPIETAVITDRDRARALAALVNKAKAEPDKGESET